MSHRKTLIGVSIAGHAALVTGVFISSVWDLDRLEHDSRSRAGLAVMVPPTLESGSLSPSLPEPKPITKPKQQKKLVKEPRQPRKLKDELDIKIEVGTEPGTGLGKGKGKGPGDTDGPEAGDPCKGPGGCEPPLTTLPVLELPKEPPRKIHDVRPEILRGLRIRGETAIHPPREVFDEMYRGGDHETHATLQVCIATEGTVSSVKLVRSTRYAAYDEAIVAAARRWLYRPYTANGTPVPACGMVTFQYVMK